MTTSRHHSLLGVFGLVAAVAVTMALGGCGGSGGSTTGASVPASSSSAAHPTSSPSWPKPASAALPKATANQLRAQLASYIAAKHLVGLSAAVVTPKGSWAGAVGVDGAGKAIRADSALAIASTTKTFVAAEILLLSQEGKIKLDAPVTDYVTLPFDAKGATIRQLATMTAGFPELPETTIRPQVSADLTKAWTCSDVVALVDPKAARLGTQGGAAAYNGLNYYILGMVIEKVTGRRSPVSCARTCSPQPRWTGSGPRPAPSPRHHSRRWRCRSTTPPIPSSTPRAGTCHRPPQPPAACAGAGMAADAPSLARWGYLLYGGHVIDNSLVTVMTTANPQGGDFNYGFGTMIADDNGAPCGATPATTSSTPRSCSCGRRTPRPSPCSFP